MSPYRADTPSTNDHAETRYRDALEQVLVRSRDPYTWKTFDAIALIAEKALAEGAAPPPCPVCGERFVVCDDCGTRPEGEW